jgi:hypothetical protein
LTFTALVNIHHFILDGALWKLRDSRIAALLLNAQGKPGDSEAHTQSVILGMARRLAGTSTTARTLRVATVVLLFAWAGIDQ